MPKVLDAECLHAWEHAQLSEKDRSGFRIDEIAALESIMRRFHGDLLMGGLAIREIDGVIDQEDVAPNHHHAGHFEVDAEKQSIIELGRPYLLMIDNGQSMKLVVKDLDESSDHRRLVVQFESIS